MSVTLELELANTSHQMAASPLHHAMSFGAAAPAASAPAAAPGSPASLPRVTYGPLIIKPWPGCPRGVNDEPDAPAAAGAPPPPQSPPPPHAVSGAGAAASTPLKPPAGVAGSLLAAAPPPPPPPPATGGGGKRVAVFNTGGTIGMKAGPDGALEPCPGYLAERMRAMPEFHRREMPGVALFELLPLLDSADLGPEDWVRIALAIEAAYHDFDAFVVIMGTDTMSYAASALSFILESLSKPVIITGSMLPLIDLLNDGQRVRARARARACVCTDMGAHNTRASGCACWCARATHAACERAAAHARTHARAHAPLTHARLCARHDRAVPPARPPARTEPHLGARARRHAGAARGVHLDGEHAAARQPHRQGQQLRAGRVREPQVRAPRGRVGEGTPRVGLHAGD